MSEKVQMSESEARSFESFSVKNAAIVNGALECGCKPYEDVFTYNRWRAQGWQVKKGEHGIKLGVMKTIERENEAHETERFRVRGHAAVFCRHQVKQQEAK